MLSNSLRLLDFLAVIYVKKLMMLSYKHSKVDNKLTRPVKTQAQAKAGVGKWSVLVCPKKQLEL